MFKTKKYKKLFNLETESNPKEQCNFQEDINSMDCSPQSGDLSLFSIKPPEPPVIKTTIAEGAQNEILFDVKGEEMPENIEFCQKMETKNKSQTSSMEEKHDVTSKFDTCRLAFNIKDLENNGDSSSLNTSLHDLSLIDSKLKDEERDCISKDEYITCPLIAEGSAVSCDSEKDLDFFKQLTERPEKSAREAWCSFEYSVSKEFDPFSHCEDALRKNKENTKDLPDYSTCWGQTSALPLDQTNKKREGVEVIKSRSTIDDHQCHKKSQIFSNVDDNTPTAFARALYNNMASLKPRKSLSENNLQALQFIKEISDSHKHSKNTSFTPTCVNFKENQCSSNRALVSISNNTADSLDVSSGNCVQENPNENSNENSENSSTNGSQDFLKDGVEDVRMWDCPRKTSQPSCRQKYNPDILRKLLNIVRPSGRYVSLDKCSRREKGVPTEALNISLTDVYKFSRQYLDSLSESKIRDSERYETRRMAVCEDRDDSRDDFLYLLQMYLQRRHLLEYQYL